MRDNLIQHPYEPIVNIVPITKDTIIRKKVNRQQVKLNIRVTNIWNDIKVLLLDYVNCITIDPNFKYLFSNMMFTISLSNMYIGDNMW